MFYDLLDKKVDIQPEKWYNNQGYLIRIHVFH